MRKLILTLFLSILFCRVSSADELPGWTKDVREIKLKNGMTFLVYPRGEAPIFSAYIRFKVGGMDEDPGKSGLAHFLEHMAFKGTKTIGTTSYEKEAPIMDEIEKIGEQLSAEYSKKSKADPQTVDRLRERLKALHAEQEKYLVKEELAKRMLEHGGADYNATTSKDMTSYFVTLPSEELRFWATLECERIFKPVFREFYEERDVVLEERRMRVDNDPDGKLYEAFLQKAFERSPYRIPTIGTPEEILTLTRKDLEKFWERYYDPSNAVGALVGRIDVENARKILEETFGQIPSRGPVAFPANLDEPTQKQEKKIVLSLPAEPRILVGYHKPTLPSKEDYLLDLLQIILAEGRSSRLYKSLVLETAIASQVDVSSGEPGSRLPNLFVISVDLNGGHKPAEALTLVDRELEAMRTKGPSDQELEKAKNRLKVGFLWRMKSNEELASSLSHFQIVAGSWKYMATYLNEIDHFTAEDVRKAAAVYLIPENRTIATIEP